MNKYMIVNTMDIMELLEAERERVSSLGGSNKAKNLMKLDFAEFLLASVPEEFEFEVEGVRGNGDIREFALPNLGTIGEIVTRYNMQSQGATHMSKSEGAYDTDFGAIKYEIKTSLSPNALARPSEAETTILVNHCGVFSIRKTEVLNYTNKQNRLPYNQPCGKPLTWLMVKMGYDVE